MKEGNIISITGPDGYMLGHVTKGEEFQPYLKIWKPRRAGRPWALVEGKKFHDGREVDHLRTEFPDESTVRDAFERRNQELAAEQEVGIARQREAEESLKKFKDLHEAQRQVLRKQYPETFKSLDSGENPFDAYQRDCARLTKRFIIPPRDDPQFVVSLADALKQKSPYDKIDSELVTYWISKKYMNLTEKELALEVTKATGISITPAAIKKRRERLGFVTARPTGPRPRV